MAGNFWQSSHYSQWMLDRHEILRHRAQDLKFITEEEYQKVTIFFANFIQAMGEHLKVRQQVIATATVYFKRFYARHSMKCIDPLLLAPTSIFLASKNEESGLISHSRLTAACHNLLKTKINLFDRVFPFTTQNILEAEFILLEMIDCCLVVYHPYRPLTQYLDNDNDRDLLPLAWRVCNDSLRCDVGLMYPPHQIALAAILVSSVMKDKDMTDWFVELDVDMDKVMQIARAILSLYTMWKDFDDRAQIPEILKKIPSPKLP